VSSTLAGFKRVGLHYIAFSETAIAKTRLVSHPKLKNRGNWRFRDEHRLAGRSGMEDLCQLSGDGRTSEFASALKQGFRAAGWKGSNQGY
jgi:hypothetical protein